jgi:16S rRNA pseudouridine516 synthase
MKLVKHLANLGYGTRREVEWLVAQRRVRDATGRVLTATSSVEHEDIRVDDEPLDPPQGSVVALHKPEGYVCSTRDVPPLIYGLLPDRFRLRSPLMAPIGRLDRDTSGLLLLTDDGGLNHRVTSPRTHVAKTYEAWLAAPLRGDEAVIFASGTLMLESEPAPLAPASLEILSPTHVRITLTEGRYHQVRRMFVAVGNHVERLHRAAIGSLELGELPPGSWRTLSADDVTRIFAAPPRAP